MCGGCSLIVLILVAGMWTLLAPGLPLQVAWTSAGTHSAILYSLEPTLNPGWLGEGVLNEILMQKKIPLAP